MTIPSTAQSLGEPMDPADQVNYGLSIAGMLETGEDFSTVTVSVLPDSAALGFQIGGTGYDTTLTNENELVMWFNVAPGNRADNTWSGEGAECGLEIDMVLNTTPIKRFQRTAKVQVKQL